MTRGEGEAAVEAVDREEAEGLYDSGGRCSGGGSTTGVASGQGAGESEGAVLGTGGSGCLATGHGRSRDRERRDGSGEGGMKNEANLGRVRTRETSGWEGCDEQGRRPRGELLQGEGRNRTWRDGGESGKEGLGFGFNPQGRTRRERDKDGERMAEEGEGRK